MIKRTRPLLFLHSASDQNLDSGLSGVRLCTIISYQIWRPIPGIHPAIKIRTISKRCCSNRSTFHSLQSPLYAWKSHEVCSHMPQFPWVTNAFGCNACKCKQWCCGCKTNHSYMTAGTMCKYHTARNLSGHKIMHFYQLWAFEKCNVFDLILS